MRVPALLLLLCCLLAGAGTVEAAANRITIIPTGEGNSFSPVPLPDGRVLFVTDRADNLDLAIWSADRPVELWEHYPSDDSSPRLLGDGKTVVFRSNRGSQRGTWWRRSLTEKTAHPFHQLPSPRSGRFRVVHPFDSNGDGRIDALDSGWIVDSEKGVPLTPLSLDAADPVLGRDGRLWFSLLQGGVRHIAFIGRPGDPVTADDALAPWQQWKLLEGVRHHLPTAERVDLAWDAGYRKGVVQHASDSTIRGRWQRLRAELYASGSGEAEAQATDWLRHAESRHDPYADRIRYDLALWLKRAGRGTEALRMLDRISRQPWRRRGALARAELLIGAGHAKAALQGLSRLDVDAAPQLRGEMIRLANLGLRQLATGGDRVEKLQMLLRRKPASLYLRSFWQMQLARLYLARGGYEAGLALLSREPGHPALRGQRRQLRLQLLTRLAGERLKSGALAESLALTRQALSIDACNVHVARLHFRTAARLGQVSAEAKWWQGRVAGGPQVGTPAARYIEALILTYGKQHMHAAERLLRGVVRDDPTLWPAYQTLGWLLEQGRDIKRQREALKAYQSAYFLAGREHAGHDDIVAIRSNLINLAFVLKLYDRQLELMRAWFSEEDHHIPVPLLMQAAQACFELSRGARGLAWLDRLPDSLDTEQRNRALRLRALLADQSGNYEVSVRTLSLLLADPDIDASLRQRLLLNRALAYIRAGRLEKAQRDLIDLSRMPAVHDRTGALRLDGSKLSFDGAWVASSLQAEVRQDLGEWLALDGSLMRKLARKDAPARLRGVVHQNLAVSYIRQGRWERAKEQLLLAEKLLQKRDRPLYDRVLWLRLCLSTALGEPVKPSLLARLANDFREDTKRSLEVGLLRLSQPVAASRDSARPLQGSMEATMRLRERMHAWEQLRRRAASDDAPLLGWIDFQYLRWLEHYGDRDAASRVRRQLLSDPAADPWLKWWITADPKSPNDGDTEALTALIAHTDVVLPMQLAMVDRYFQARAADLLRRDRSRDALDVLIERERDITRLRHRAVKARPLPPSESLDRLRRELRPNEAMTLIWPSSDGGGSDLWWMDNGHVLYKHLEDSSASGWFDAIRMWQQGKRRLFVSFVNPSLKDFEAFRKVAAGQRLVFSPTLLHAAAIGRLMPDQSSFSAASWRERLWQQADASTMDWRWHLNQGVAAYRQQRWADAIDHLQRVLPSVSDAHRGTLLLLIGKSALNGGLEPRGWSIFAHAGALPSALEPIALRLKATALEKQGLLPAAADAWSGLYHRSGDWRDKAEAANALTSLALRGIVPSEQVGSIVTQALAALPARAPDQRLMLLMDRMRLINQFHPKGGWGTFLTAAGAAQKLIEATNDRALEPQLQLMRIEAAWKYGRYAGLFHSLDALRRDIPEGTPQRFDLDNLRALIQQSMGRMQEARRSFMSARHALVWVAPEMVNERLAGWHNNVGRLELSLGQMQEALAHFRAAIDIDNRRGDRIGLLYDWKNLGRLLVQAPGHRAEGVVLLQKGVHAARKLGVPRLEADFIFSLLAAGEQGSERGDDNLARFATLVQGNHYDGMNWALHWLQAEAALGLGHRDEAVALLKRAVSEIVTGMVPFPARDRMFGPRRPFEALIALLADAHPVQALSFAEEAHRLSLASRFQISPAPDQSGRTLHGIVRGTRLVYFTGEDRTWCWLLDARGVRVKELAVGYGQLARQVARLNQEVSGRVPAKALARQLAAEIWLPLRAWLPEGGSIEVVASGPLRRLAFAMLDDGKSWLVSHYAFGYPLYAYSGRPSDLRVGRMGLFYDSGEPKPLLLASQEVEAAKDFSRSQADVVADPTPSRFVHASGRYRWVHLAAHIDVMDGYPRFSYLQLQPGEGGDGRLYVHALLKQRWKTASVVLSGCGSRDGENPFGRAFLLAGAKQTLSDLWSGNDLSLSILMKAFYREMRHAPSVAIALQRAQAWMLARYPDPVDWAGLRLDYR